MKNLLSMIRRIVLNPLKQLCFGSFDPPPSIVQLGGFKIESDGLFVASASLGTHRGGCGGTVRLLFDMAVCSVCKRTLNIDKDIIYGH